MEFVSVRFMLCGVAPLTCCIGVLFVAPFKGTQKITWKKVMICPTVSSSFYSGVLGHKLWFLSHYYFFRLLSCVFMNILWRNWVLITFKPKKIKNSIKVFTELFLLVVQPLHRLFEPTLVIWSPNSIISLWLSIFTGSW